MTTANSEYSKSVEDGLLSFLDWVQAVLQLPQPQRSSSSAAISYPINASIEASVPGEWAILSNHDSELVLQNIQLKASFDKTIDNDENTHVQLTATFTVNNVTFEVDGFIPQLRADKPMDLLLNISSESSQQSFPVEKVLSLINYTPNALPSEFPQQPGMALVSPPTSCTISLHKETPAADWLPRMLTFQMILHSDWVITPDEIVWLKEGTELHISPDHQLVATGKVLIGSNPSQAATMKVSADNNTENGIIELSLVTGSVHDIWSTLTGLNQGPTSSSQEASQFPNNGSGTLVVSCRKATDSQTYDIVEVEFKVPFPAKAVGSTAAKPISEPAMAPDPSNNTVQPPSNKTSSYPADPSNIVETSSSGTAPVAVSSTSPTSGNAIPAQARASTSSSAGSLQSQEKLLELTLSPSFNGTQQQQVDEQAVGPWKVDNQENWTLTSPNPATSVFSMNQSTFDPQQLPLELIPVAISSVSTMQKGFLFSFNINVSSAVRLYLTPRDKVIRDSVRAIWEPLPSNSSIGSFAWYYKDLQIPVDKYLVHDGQPALFKFYYDFDIRKQLWNMVIFQGANYIFNANLAPDMSPAPGILVHLTSKASVQLNTSNVLLQSNETSGPVS